MSANYLGAYVMQEAIQPVEEQNAEQSAEEAAEEETTTDNSSTTSDGVSFLEAVLIALGLYIILSGCIYLFIRSRKNAQKNEELVTMDQYRAERVRLMERIKAVEIEVENMKNAKHEAASEKRASAPVIPAQPVVAHCCGTSEVLCRDVLPCTCRRSFRKRDIRYRSR